MNDKKEELENVSPVEDTKKDDDLISSEDVLAVVNGDQVALVEQMERAKEAALASGDVREEEAEKARKKLEEKAKKEAAIMAEVKRRKEEAERKERLAKEEAERKRREAEAERQRQLAEQARQAELARQKAEQERLEAERKKQEIEAAKKAKEAEKQAKIQARIDAKNAKIAAREAAKKAKEEAKQARIQAKIDAAKKKEEEKKAKIQARIDAKKAKEDARKVKIEQMEAAKKAKEEARKLKKEKGKKKEEVKIADRPVTPVANNTTTNTVIQSTPTFTPTVVQSTPVPSTPSTTSSTSVSTSKVSNPVPPASPASSTSLSTDKIVNEKEVPNNLQGNNVPKKESNVKYYLTAIFFIFLILMVIFLPDISSFISNYFNKKQEECLPEVTTGTLYCKLDTNDDNFDYSYEASFKFKNKQMYQLTFITTAKGDQNLDALQLSEMKSSCDLLHQYTLEMDGVLVSCDLSNGVFENKQILNYDAIDVDSVSTAYLEAGGTYPNYQYLQNIDDIEQEMKSSNYTCERSE